MDRSRDRWPALVGAVAALGGLSWIAKVGVIVATGGEVVDTGAAAVFYLIGVALLAASGALAGFWLAAGRGLPLRVVAAVVGLIGFFVMFFVLNTLAQAVVGDRGPEYAGPESGILLTGVVALAAGGWLWLRAARPSSIMLAG